MYILNLSQSYHIQQAGHRQYACEDISLNLESAHARVQAMPEVDGPIKQGTTQPLWLHPGKTEDF